MPCGWTTSLTECNPSPQAKHAFTVGKAANNNLPLTLSSVTTSIAA